MEIKKCSLIDNHGCHAYNNGECMSSLCSFQVKEKVMQKFEQGDKVETITSEVDKTWYESIYDVDCTYGHVVTVCGVPTIVSDKHIRPAKLICDEARKMLAEGLEYKMECDSKEEFNELSEIVKMYGVATFIHLLYDTDPKTRQNYREKNLPELNLKTSVVTPRVGESIGLLDEVMINNAKIIEREKAYDGILKSNIALSEQLTQEQTNNDKLKHQLNEKTEEIELQNTSLDRAEKTINKRDITIDEYKGYYHNFLNKTSNLEEHLDSALKEKDAEVKQLNHDLMQKMRHTNGLDKTIKQKDAEIERLKHDLAEYKTKSAELTNIVTDAFNAAKKVRQL